MKILSLVFMALSWFTSGFFLAFTVWWSIEEDKREMNFSLIRTVCFSAVGVVWALLIFARYMS